MKISYFPETDSLYIELKEAQTSVESEETSPGIVLDFNKQGEVIGIEIDSQASRKVDLKHISYQIFEPPIPLEKIA